MARHRSSTSPEVELTNARGRSEDLKAQLPAAIPAAEVTDIIPFNEFGDLPDLPEEPDCFNGSAFDRESRVIRAPELDDLHDDDDLTPLRLAVPSKFRPEPHNERLSNHAYRDSHTDVSDGVAATDVINIAGRGGQHRKPDTSAAKSRVMIAAMAAGATAAGAYSLSNASETQAAATVVAAGEDALNASVVTGSEDGIQVVSVASASSSAVHAEEITKAAAFAQERAEREARLQRPLFVMPTTGMFTSGFGYRWGVLHGGIDIANSIGTPVLAASDGVVIEAGPYAGYGNQIRLRHSDGTVTLYGHLSSILVNVGERVMAGDQIGKMGSTGNSTGPHLHFEVLVNGANRVDPTGWLAKRGISLGG